MQTKTLIGLVLITASLFFSSCEKDFDSPPVKPLGEVITIDDLRSIYTGSDTVITDDISIYGIVTADEVTGNIYKELFIQDETNAIKLGLTSSSDFYIGDRVRVSLNGATLTDDTHNMLMIDNVDPDVSIIRQESSLDLTPEVVTISDIMNFSGNFSTYQSKLVQINYVEFVCADVCNTWADAITQSDKNRDLTDTLGNIIIVRSSGYSNFANQALPQGKGSIIAVVSQYNTDIQLTIRNPAELTMYGTRKTTCPSCPIYLHTQNWSNNNITSSGWTTQYPVPNNVWTTDNFSGSDPYAYITNSSSKLVGESWLISPSFDLSSTSTPQFNFTTATFASNTALSIMISTNYDGVSLPATATWTDITNVLPFALSSGSWNWTTSGDFDLAPYKVPGVYIAFKYTGTSATQDSWEIDNFNLTDY